MSAPTEYSDDNEDRPTLANGMQLISLICTGINALKLSREAVIKWTNNAKLLREWINLLATDWKPQGTITVPEDRGRKTLCQITDTGYRDFRYIDRFKILTTKEWIREVNVKSSLSETLEKFTSAITEPQTSVFRCDIVEEITWGVKLLRQIFNFDGPDSVLIRAFAARDTLWSVEQVLSLVSRIIHDHNDDPLQLQDIIGTAIFPVYTTPIHDEDGKIDEEQLLKSIRIMTVVKSGERHLGKEVWEFRLLYSIHDLISHRLGYGDAIIRKYRNTIFFRSSPLPREKDSMSSNWNPAIHG